MLAVITLVALSFWFSGCVFIIPEITVEPVNIFDPANDWYGSIVVEFSTPDYSENNPLSFFLDRRESQYPLGKRGAVPHRAGLSLGEDYLARSHGP